MKRESNIGCASLFIVLLQVLFIAVKLTGHVEWPWWRVLMPLIMYAAMLTGVIFIVVAALAYDAHKDYTHTHRKRSKR